MNISCDQLINIISIGGIVNCLLFALLILLNAIRNKERHSFAFSGFLIITTCITINWVLKDIGLFERGAIISSTPFQLYWGVGPCMYIYVKMLVDKNYKFSGRQYFHFVPVILQLVFHTIMALLPKAGDALPVGTTIYLIDVFIEHVVGILSAITYFVFTHRIIKHHKLSTEKYNYLGKVQFYRWLGLLELQLLFLISIWSFCFLFDCVSGLTQPANFYTILFFVLLACIHSFVFTGYFYTQKIRPVFTETDKSDDDIDCQYYLDTMNSTITSHDLYLNSKLTLKEFSEACELSTSSISVVLKNELKMSFYDYVNHFRIAKAKEMLTGDILKFKTIQTIAEECGFHSRSTFYAAFKKHTDQTPTEFVKNNSESAA